MKTAAFASVLALLGAVSAAPVEPRADASPSAYPDCDPTSAALYFPESVTVGEPFAVRFCSGTYFKRSSRSITLAISAAGTTDLNLAVILTDELASADNKQYDFEATVPRTMFTFPEETYLMVVEKTNDYYVKSSYEIHNAQVKVVTPPSS
ncbi:hypothetical protein HDZ31DRAFT_67852 [Schizophyllum fasciatum]